jgi:sirohydrochlorin ferrochelatase
MTASNPPRTRPVSPLGRRRPAPPALVLVAHGSRDPRALTTVRSLMARIRALRPGLPVRLGHIELNEPLLPDTLAALGDTRAVLVPLLLSRGYHVKQDIPEMAATARGDIRTAGPLGPHPLLAEALHARLTEAGWPAAPDDTARRTTAVVPVIPAYASAARPSVPTALRALAARGRHRVAVASCFTAPGRFATQCASQAPWIASAPLGAHEAMARLVLHRYDQSVAVPWASAA